MKHFLSNVLLLIFLLFPPPVSAGTVALLGAGKGAAVAAYSGPGDAVSGAIFWIGLRGYNAAYSGNAVNVCTPLDAVCSDITIVSGALNSSTLGTLACNSVTCTIKTWYDQSGNTNCGGAACNFTQATIASRAVLIVAGGSGCPTAALPCAKFTDSPSATYEAVATAIAGTQPFTISTVFKRDSSGGGSYGTILADAAGNNGLYSRAGNVDLYLTGDHNVTATDDVYHAVQSVGSGASSATTVDGSTTTFSATTNAMAAKSIGADGAGISDVLKGYVQEVGFWGSAFSAGNIAAMNTNQHNYWGF